MEKKKNSKEVKKNTSKSSKTEVKKNTSKNSKKEIKKVEKKEEVKETKSKKKTAVILSVISVIVLAVIAFILWWFLRKFDVTFKYNNGLEDYITKVRYLNIINKSDVKEDLVLEEHAFLGYFETYLLSKKEIEALNKDQNLVDKICKNGFNLNVKENKCVANEEFDFDNTKIIENKTIEALWSEVKFSINPTNKTIYIGNTFTISTSISGTDDKTVKWSSNNSNIATVDSKGSVKGIKEGNTTIVAISNGIKRTCSVTVKKPEPKISLSASKSCIIGSQDVKINATITNGTSNGITWDFPECFSWQDNSDTQKTLTRTSGRNRCSETEGLTPTVTAKLNTGQKASVSFKYEPTLTVKVYDNSTEIYPAGNGAYYGNYIKLVANVNASFSGNYISSTTSNSVQLGSAADTTITVKTSCGQSKAIVIKAVIN